MKKTAHSTVEVLLCAPTICKGARPKDLIEKPCFDSAGDGRFTKGQNICKSTYKTSWPNANPCHVQLRRVRKAPTAFT
ncbi:hypothetical protein CEXT_55431 [Caerostris extrusa]|uniref:Uncharacterized protein n=1 Tax=Caerostris extrusa TaxID=172846 RepID=A0AAV4VQT2_CAEEX|nr:hypothetical protein CEXT_55431 [Caerostris extrusa]